MYSPTAHVVVLIAYAMRRLVSPHVPGGAPPLGRDTHICADERVGKLSCHKYRSLARFVWYPAPVTAGTAVAHPKHEPSPLLFADIVVEPAFVVSVMDRKAAERDTGMASGVDWHTTALATVLTPNDHTPVVVAVVAAAANAMQVLG